MPCALIAPGQDCAGENALVRELAFRHHQMVRLVMAALHRDTHEAERLEPVTCVASALVTTSLTPLASSLVVAFQPILRSSLA
jgi:hypothetical protein